MSDKRKNMKELYVGDSFKMDDGGNILRTTGFKDVLWGFVVASDKNSVTFGFPTSEFLVQTPQRGIK